MKNDNDYIICRVCDEKVNRLYGAHLKSHGMTSDDYKKLYPGEPLTCKTDKNNTFKNSGIHMRKEKYKEMFSEKIKGDKNPNHKSKTTKEERKERSPFSKNFINYDNEEQTKDFIKMVADKREYSTRIDYYINRGFSEEESTQKLKERQTTFTLEKCIEKYGEKIGEEKFTERQQKWQDEIHKKIQKTGISIKPTYIDIRIVYKSVDVDPNSEYYKFIYLIYLSLDTEMNSRISQVYHYLYDFGINDKDILLDKLKLHKNWGYLEMLEKFDYENFIETNIKEMGESGLLKITNELIDKFKDKFLNKRTKSLNFIDNPTRNLNDLYDFYKNWNIYFNKKSKKHRDKFLYLISEIIEALNGNRPFNEDFRNRKFDPQLK